MKILDLGFKVRDNKKSQMFRLLLNMSPISYPF